MDERVRSIVNNNLDRLDNYYDRHPWRVRLAAGATVLAGLGIVFGTPVHKYTVDPIQHGIEWISDKISDTQNTIENAVRTHVEDIQSDKSEGVGPADVSPIDPITVEYGKQQDHSDSPIA